MTDEEKQIEEMANAIFDYVDTQKKDHVYICNNKATELAKPFLHNTAVAEFMYKRGYRKQSDTAKEIFQSLYNRTQNYYGDRIILTSNDVKELAEKYGVKLEV